MAALALQAGARACFVGVNGMSVDRLTASRRRLACRLPADVFERHVATVAEALSPMGDTPVNERQARELAPLRDDPDAMQSLARVGVSDVPDSIAS